MDYSGVTESAGNRITPEALSMMYTRYRFAMDFCVDRAVLEVASGNGQGLGYLARRARRVVGGDYTEALVRRTGQYYKGRVPVLRLDAHHLPFRASSFDVVILYEALYYLARPTIFLEECRRILRNAGVLLICTVNKEWEDFNPSPFSTTYYSARELHGLLTAHHFRADLYGAFPAAADSFRAAIVSKMKRLAVRLHLIPRTMKGKALFKRLFMGRLVTLPAEMHEGIAPYAAPQPIEPAARHPEYKVIYAVAHVS